MKIFNLSRGKGKTIRMLYASEYQNIPILCSNRLSKLNILEMAKKYEINIPEPMSVQDVANGRLRGKRFDGVLVDDMDLVLFNLLQNYDLNMMGGTITV